MDRLSVARCNSRMVEQAEPHGPVRRCVMTGRPAQHERTTAAVRHDCVHCGDRPTGCQTCDVKRVLTHWRVRIQMGSAMVNERTDLPNHFFTVTPLKILHGGWPRSHAVKSMSKRRIFIERCKDAFQSPTRLEMNRTGVVPKKRFVVEQMNRHGRKDTPDIPEDSEFFG